MLKLFRTIAYLEGVSLLLLLCVAMPLKYLAGAPQAVRVVGWMHGLLFIGYVGVLAQIRAMHRWSTGKTVLAFVAAVVPFGTFAFDRALRRRANTPTIDP